jgi:lysophospholipase L1-like esterase
MKRLLATILACMLLGVGAQAQDKKVVTIFLAGDSTMAEKLPTKRPETGWGEFLQQALDEGRVKVENHAKNGRSTRTFIAEGLWQQILDKLKKGDYVFIQFGHNDESKSKTDRYTPPDDYRANLVRMVNEVHARKAHPVLLTPVMRRRFDAEHRLVDSHGEYPDIVRGVAASQKVPLLDLHHASQNVLEQYGEEGSRQLFLQLKPGEDPNYPDGIENNTHFRPEGAKIMCDLVVKQIREKKLKVKKYLQK